MDRPSPRLNLPRPSSAAQGLIIVNIGVMLLSAGIGPNIGGRLLTGFLGVSVENLFDGFGLGLLRLLTYQFAHADILHILVNMLLLYVFSNIVRGEVGGRGLVHLYLVAGIVGALGHLLLAGVTGGSAVRVIGASGSVYGIMVYAARMHPRAIINVFGILPIELRWLVTILVLIGVYSSLTQLHGAQTSVSDGAHLGGAAGGWLAFEFLRGYYQRLGYGGGPLFPAWQRWRQERQRAQAVDLQATLDRLLEKVHREGMAALTAAERKQLERASRDLKKD